MGASAADTPIDKRGVELTAEDLKTIRGGDPVQWVIDTVQEQGGMGA